MQRHLTLALLGLTLGACATDDELGTTESELTGSSVPVYLRDLMVWDVHDPWPSHTIR